MVQAGLTFLGGHRLGISTPSNSAIAVELSILQLLISRRRLLIAQWVSRLRAGADPDLMDNRPSSDSRSQFPSHTEPRVWLITAGDSPIGISVARQVLAHGDYALLGLAHSVLERDERRRNGFDAFLAEIEEHRDEGWKQRVKAVPLDIRCAHSSLGLV